MIRAARTLVGQVRTHLKRRLLPKPKCVDRYRRVHVFEWSPEGGAINFGDRLASVVVAKMLSNAGLALDEEVQRSRRLLSVGSVMHFASTGDVIWGSGINGKVAADQHRFDDLDVRAVRGPRTGEWLRARGISSPEIYGDPALLIPVLFPGRFVRQAKRPILFVPNLHDLSVAQTKYPSISPLQGWNRVVECIVESEFVIASSLHGLVIAEAFGIPARYVRLSNAENIFKYEDYVFGTGRETFRYATNFAQAETMGGMPPISFDHGPLTQAFPIDLWQSKDAHE